MAHVMVQQTAVFRLDGVTKRYGDVTALENVTFEAGVNEYISLLGPSGSGKTSLLRVIAGFEAPDSGRVYLNGRDVTNLPAHERGIGFVFQNFALFPHLSVMKNVAFGLVEGNSPVPAAEVESRCRKMIEMVGLAGLEERGVDQISGGQKQRVALARTLVMQPKLVLLDEPLGALDKKLREQTQFELVNIIEKVGVTVVMVTHDQEEAMTMASRIAIMSKGRVLQVGTPEEIYEHPRNKFVADFIGNVNLFAGKLTLDAPDRCAATTGIGEVHVGHGVSGTLNMPVSIAVRPEKIEISKARPEHAAFNLFQGKVKEIGYLGSYTNYILQARDGSKVRVTEANTSRQDLSDITWEDEVYFWWDDKAAVVLRD